MSGKYAWLFFDLFDTLWWVDEGVYYAGKRGAAEAVKVDYDAFIEAWRRTSPEASVGKIRNPFERARIALEALGISDRAAAAEVARRDVETIQRCVGFYDGAPAALRELKERGFSLGLISNATATTAFAVTPLRLREYLDLLVFSYEVGVVKPDPVIYRAALERACCPADRALFVGDGANHELDAATDLGLDALCMDHPVKATSFRDAGRLSGSGHKRVTSFGELLALPELAEAGPPGVA